MNKPLLDLEKDDFFNKLKHADKGLICPCCDRFAKIYSRKLTATTCRELICLYNTGGDFNYIHASKLVFEGLACCDIGKAKYFGLVVLGDNENPEKKTSGCWKLTSAGIRFVKGFLSIPKYVHIYNDKVLSFDDSEELYIQDCLGNKFNYQELMAK
mgnify:CR=1 FL=1|tara:strand:+ start:615 stop:1082 length:468 start_codon:yes stop_codon:yes gene_type:complete